MARQTTEALTLTELARVGFADLGVVRERLVEVADLGGPEPGPALALLSKTASPDAALAALLDLLRSAPAEIGTLLAHTGSTLRFLRVAGASTGLTEFFLRHPEELDVLLTSLRALPTKAELRADLLASVGAVDGFATLVDDGAWVALRVRYRRRLAEIAAFDLEQGDPVAGVDAIAESLADLAAAALDAALAVARSMSSGSVAAHGVFPIEQVRATRLAVIGMGKAGAGELNYVSDVDVIFVAGGDDGTPFAQRARTAPWCAPSNPTWPTTSAGRRVGSFRRC
jgi:glutamate-ammonia-ligase adenylyltransferase